MLSLLFFPFSQLCFDFFAFPAGFACVDPPDLSASNITVVNYTAGDLVDFNDGVTFQCEPGFHFNSSYEKANFSLQCFDTGLWEAHDGDACVDPQCKYIVSQ